MTDIADSAVMKDANQSQASSLVSVDKAAGGDKAEEGGQPRNLGKDSHGTSGVGENLKLGSSSGTSSSTPSTKPPKPNGPNSNRRKTGNRRSNAQQKGGRAHKENPNTNPREQKRKRKSPLEAASSNYPRQSHQWQAEKRYKTGTAGYDAAGFIPHMPFQPPYVNLPVGAFPPADPSMFSQPQPLMPMPAAQRPPKPMFKKPKGKKGNQRAGMPHPPHKTPVPRSDRVPAPENNSSYLIRANNRGFVSSRIGNSPALTPGPQLTPGALRATPKMTSAKSDPDLSTMDGLDFFGSNHGLIIRASHGIARKLEDSSDSEEWSSEGEEDEEGVDGYKLVQSSDLGARDGEVRALQDELTKKTAYISTLEEDNLKLRESLARVEAALAAAGRSNNPTEPSGNSNHQENHPNGKDQVVGVQPAVDISAASEAQQTPTATPLVESSSDPKAEKSSKSSLGADDIRKDDSLPAAEVK
mmetsp:Transcript_16366/g.19624  ORF Transcript_16366/g.19624 Transcript_16366/m.19624 type:complete len:470 (-) Transcript_16366:2871-4280(-)